jgi:hypothetical protein
VFILDSFVQFKENIFEVENTLKEQAPKGETQQRNRGNHSRGEIYASNGNHNLSPFSATLLWLFGFILLSMNGLTIA